MCGYRFLHHWALVSALLIGAVAIAGSARAQSDAELEALDQHVIDLYRAGK
jgi:hypothetical protein